MTIKEALKEGHNILFYAEVDTPVLDAIVLLSEALEISKEELFASLPEDIDDAGYLKYRELLDMRCSGLPVSYIRRRKEFYGLDFYVDQRVLVPRPETEMLVEEVVQVASRNPAVLRVHDACTGSGCIAITLKRLLPHLEISASDISPDAEEVFTLNRERILGEDLPFHRSDLLADVPGTFDIIVANPPYLRDAEVLNMKKIGWPEPGLALKGGEDGTDLAGRLIRQAQEKLRQGGRLIMEADGDQMTKLFALMDSCGYRYITVRRDMAQRERMIMAGV
jgi:release factor glutamine methyltransferase